MFQNLRSGNQVFILHKDGRPSMETGTVVSVSMPMPSLGSLASEALSGVYSYSYRLVIPAVMICLIVLSLNLLGDGLRDAFDPKLKK